MGLFADIFRYLIIERPAKNKTKDDLITSLTESAQTVSQRLQSAPQTDKNHALATHIIGIERWSQQRLGAALGQDCDPAEEYDKYRPAKDTSWDELASLFGETRQRTLELAQALQAAQLDNKVTHNDFGDVSARGWLHYMDVHAKLESKRMK